jgi:SAM-dependent methyltransferase
MNDYDAVADLYDAYVTDTRDHAFWSRWAARASGPVLELTAGTGRATLALARGASGPVTALDLSPAMLAQLVRRLRGEGKTVHAVAADMVRLPLPAGHYALAVIPFNSFGELVGERERVAALRELRRVLRPDGRAIVTLHDPVSRRRSLDDQPRVLGPFPSGDGTLDVLVRGRSTGIDSAESEQVYRLRDQAGRLVEERRLTLRFVLPDEDSLRTMAAGTDLDVEAWFGAYDESPYVPGCSPFMITVLRRRQATRMDDLVQE